MYWIVVSTDCYGEHVTVDSSETYARAVYERLSADEDIYSVELYRAELLRSDYK